MTIQLPDVPGYFEKIQAGTITRLRLPKEMVSDTNTVTVWTGKPNDMKINLEITGIQETGFDSITLDEAEAEGYTVPDFCSRFPVCKNMELRIDFDGITISDDSLHSVKSMAGVDRELYRRVTKGCHDCLIQKTPKELFNDFWKTMYPNCTQDQMVSVISFKLA